MPEFIFSTRWQAKRRFTQTNFEKKVLQLWFSLLVNNYFTTGFGFKEIEGHAIKAI